MKDDEFRILMITLRDRGIRLIQKRQSELRAWDLLARKRVIEWFGDDKEETKTYIRDRLGKCFSVMKELTSSNFIRYSKETVTQLGCLHVDLPLRVAAVCKTDISTHKILITPAFCSLEDFSGSISATKLGTLIHEVSHFEDTFDTDDAAYSFKLALDLAAANSFSARRNADNIAGYITWGMGFKD